MKKRFLITAAQAFSSPNKNFLNGLEQYASDNDSKIIVLPMIGNSAAQDWHNLHPQFEKYRVLYEEMKLNNNIRIGQHHIRPYMIDPATGLGRFVQRETSLILGSPKQRLEPIPHSTRKGPKYLVTTGACTYPNYATGDDTSAERRRLGKIASMDHTYGALVVEVENGTTYHMRHLRGDSRGNFVDLGTRYNGKKKTNSVLEAMVVGDYHNGQWEKGIRDTTHRMIKELQPQRLVLHDFFDAHSVSHHIDKQFLRQKILQQVDYNHQFLDDELREGYEELRKLEKLMDGREIAVVMSNHNEFLHRYLDEGRFMKDAANVRIGLKLASYMVEADYNDPVEAGIRMNGELENVRFLTRDDDYKVKGYHLGSHGDKGPGFGYGSIHSKERDWGKSISGHVHKAQIIRNTYTVGTLLPFDTYYMRGQPSAWAHANACLWDNGTVQLLQMNKGRWRSK